MSGTTGRRTDAVDPWEVAATVTDPELPTLTLADLGVLRDVRVEDDGTVVLEITPTYTGCPAMGVMRADLVHALHRAGFPDVDVRTVLSPAWTTDWMTEAGRQRLRAYGIAPPAPRASRRALFGLDEEVACPRAGRAVTEQLYEFRSTASKALWRCTACKEPLHYV